LIIKNNNFNSKKKKLSLAIIVWIIFKTCSHKQFALSHPNPSNQCSMGLLGTFKCTNKFCIVVYFFMRWPWLSKRKFKANCTILFFLSRIWIEPWMIYYNNVFKTLCNLKLFISNMSIVFQEVSWWLSCFQSETSLGTKSFSMPSIRVHTLHRTWTTFPLEPKIDST